MAAVYDGRAVRFIRSTYHLPLVSMSGDLTITEKIFARAAGGPARAGDYVLAAIDRAMTHDITGPLAVVSSTTESTGFRYSYG